MEYEIILTGINTFSPDWLYSINKIKKQNIIICNFNEISLLNNILKNNKIKYILPLSEIDFNYAITNIKNIKILYPEKNITTLLNNKIQFIQFMLENYPNNIPKVYYLNNTKINDIEFPVISKPIFTCGGQNMSLYQNQEEFNKCNNKIIIQQFITFLYEYSAYFFCIDGVIINYKIIKYKYPEFYIKNKNFPKDFINVLNFDIALFNNLISKFNYSGGMCIDFKYDEFLNNVYLFEINPRFGGSAFTNDFIYDLLCINKNF